MRVCVIMCVCACVHMCKDTGNATLERQETINLCRHCSCLLEYRYPIHLSAQLSHKVKIKWCFEFNRLQSTYEARLSSAVLYFGESKKWIRRAAHKTA